MIYKISCQKGKSYTIIILNFTAFLCILESYGYNVRHKMVKMKNGVDLRQWQICRYSCMEKRFDDRSVCVIRLCLCYERRCDLPDRKM